MFLQRTSKAQQELSPGQRLLGLRERSLLLLAEEMPRPELERMYHGQGQALLQQLITQGYLQARSAKAQARPAPVSLAGMRMHLFDLCERMFANRLPDTAEQLRSRLRQARDADSMQQAKELLLRAVQEHAGPERAQALRQQLADMLPDGSLDNT